MNKIDLRLSSSQHYHVASKKKQILGCLKSV